MNPNLFKVVDANGAITIINVETGVTIIKGSNYVGVKVPGQTQVSVVDVAASAWNSILASVANP